jgi:hypothetical protein
MPGARMLVHHDTQSQLTSQLKACIHILKRTAVTINAHASRLTICRTFLLKNMPSLRSNTASSTVPAQQQQQAAQHNTSISVVMLSAQKRHHKSATAAQSGTLPAQCTKQHSTAQNISHNTLLQQHALQWGTQHHIYTRQVWLQIFEFLS